VSSRNQKTDSQRAAIERWLQSHAVDPTDVQWFIDHESGKTTKRSGFDRLRQAIFAGTVKTVVVWKLDRLSRRQRDGINLLADWCDRGIRVISVTQQIDLSGPVGRMVASVMFGLAEIELEYRRERQAAGIRLAKERGTYRGRAKGTTKSDPRRAWELAVKGLKVNEIATALGVSERTVLRYLGGSGVRGLGVAGKSYSPTSTSISASTSDCNSKTASRKSS